MISTRRFRIRLQDATFGPESRLRVERLELRLTGQDKEKKEKWSWIISFAGHDLFHVLPRSVNTLSHETVTVQIQEIRVLRKNGHSYRVPGLRERKGEHYY